ncbi:MAG TPA: VCBS repeat-containing protein [Caldilineae bacterium]|nr:VCBS repeat-containing protein [Caldilineae bacterium]
MHYLTFRRHTIYTGPPSERTTCLVGDLDGDGVPEIVIGARAPRPELYWLDRTATGEWEAHLIDEAFETLEAGGVLADLDGDGDLDLIAGHDARGNGLFWWECPDDPTRPWTRHEICRMPANKSHDQLVADIDGDGRPELYFWNQGAATLFWVPVPEDPYVSPWPGIRPVATNVNEEGLAVADVDGDGRLELIAGQSWYRLRSNGEWERHVFAEGYVSPRVVAADFDGDGRVEIVLAEGDASLNGREYGRLVRFRAGPDPEALWEPKLLHDRLLDPHSLQVADFDGDGRPDLFVGEMGLPDGRDPHPPAQRIYLSRGDRLQEYIIDRGLGTHESKVIGLDGRVGIVGKPFRTLRSPVPRPPEVDSIHLWLPT